MIDIRNIPGLEEDEAKHIVGSMFARINALSTSMREIALRAHEREKVRHEAVMRAEQSVQAQDLVSPEEEARYADLESVYIDTCLDIHAVTRDPAFLKYVDHHSSRTSEAYIRATNKDKTDDKNAK